MTGLLSVTKDGIVTVNGVEIVNQVVELTKLPDEDWQLTATVPIIAWEGLDGQPARVSFIARVVGAVVDYVDAEGETVAAALRALADKLEQTQETPA